MKNKILLCFIALTAASAYCQTEYLVTVNPENCSYQIVNSLPDINYIAIFPNFTTFDENNKRYILKGKDFSGNLKLYTIDAITGAMIYNPPFPVADTPTDNLVELQYDNTGNELYALNWNYAEQTEYFVSMDLATGQYTLINSLPVSEPVSAVPLYSNRRFSTFDKNDRQYIFTGEDLDNNKKIFTVDASTGIVLYYPDFPVLSDSSDLIFELQYDNSTNTLYGIYLDYSEAKFYIVSISKQTGLHTIVCSIPGLTSVESGGYTAFDETNHKFIFHGLGNGIWKIFSVNVNSGITTSTADFYSLLAPNDNVIEFQMDNSTATLYALHWVNSALGIPSTVSSDIKISPNPATGSFSVRLNKIYTEVTVELFDMLGQKIKSEDFSATDSFTVNTGGLANGVYEVKLSDKEKVIGTQKLVIH